MVAKNNESSRFGFWWFRVNLLSWSMKMASAAARSNFILAKLEWDDVESTLIIAASHRKHHHHQGATKQIRLSANFHD